MFRLAHYTISTNDGANLFNVFEISLKILKNINKWQENAFCQDVIKLWKQISKGAEFGSAPLLICFQSSGRGYFVTLSSQLTMANMTPMETTHTERNTVQATHMGHAL